MLDMLSWLTNRAGRGRRGAGLWLGAGVALMGASLQAQIGGTLQFSTNSYFASESAGYVTFTVARGGASGNSVTVSYATTNGTALAGVDYLDKSGTLVFGPFEVVKTFSVLLLDNTVTNVAKTVGLTLSNPTGGAALGATANALLTITDNDSASDVVGFEFGNYNVTENSGPALVTVVRTGGKERRVTVDFTTLVGGTATAGADYVPVMGTLTFEPGQSIASFVVTNLDDTIVGEGDEIVFLALTNPGPANAAVLGQAIATLTILENDFTSSSFLFNAANYTANEGDLAATITVTRAGTAVGVATVDYFTQDGDAQAGVDYVATSGTLLFTNGQRFASFQVRMVDDNVVDPNEVVELVLTNATGGATIALTNATLTILDNDSRFRFSSDRFVTNENGLYAVVTVLREGGLAGTASVDLYTMDGGSPTGALSGFDYSYVNTTLTFGDGQTFTNVAIPITDDYQIETNSESFYVVLTNLVGAQLGTPSVAEVVILDNDSAAGTFEFNYASASSVPEYGLRITVAVSRRGGNSGAASVSVQPAFFLFDPCPGTTNARQNFDYTGGFTTLSWDDQEGGDKTFEIRILDDDQVELDEMVILELYNATGGAAISAIGNRIGAQILYDDQPPGAFDRYFNMRSQTNATPGANTLVYAVALYTSGPLAGKAVVGGEFTGFNSMVRNRIARVNMDGSLDSAFDAGQGADGFVNAVALQADGKVLMGGGFSTVAGVSRAGIARLNENGSLDTSFNTGAGVDGYVAALALQGDGKVLVGGLFSSYNGAPLTNLVRLNADGTLDPTFNAGLGPNDVVRSLALQADGKVLLGGDFSTVNGSSRAYLGRLNGDGTVDSAFNPGSGPDGPVYAVAVQGDGRILVGGMFSSFNGRTWGGVARLNADGSLDETGFNPGIGFDGPVLAIAFQTDGKPVLGGGFSSYDGILRANVARLYVDGTLDTGFMDTYYNQSAGPDQFVAAVAVLPFGVTNTFLGTNIILAANSVYIGGAFTLGGGGMTATDTLEQRYFARLVGGDIQPVLNLPGNVEFVLANYSVDEAGGVLAVTVRRANGYTGNLQVNYATWDGSARAGVDYETTSGQLFWNHCELADQTFLIPVFDNGVADGNKTFTVKLSDPVSTGIYSQGRPALGFQSRATVMIVDNDFDRGYVGFSAPSYYVDEGGSNAVITVTRTGSSNGFVSVQFSTVSGGSAQSILDYTAVGGTLTFNAGETSKTFQVKINNDPSKEPEETILLALHTPNGGVRLREGETNAAVVIMDNDGGVGSLSFSTNTFAAAEASGLATVTVRRTSGIASNVNVSFYTATNLYGPGWAFPGVDFLPTNGTLSFLAGETTRTFQVPILEDRIVEGAERLLVVLTNATGGAGIGFQSNAVVTLVDDDAYGRLTLTSPDLFVSELAGELRFDVVRTDGSADEVYVDFSVLPGTATEGEDFVGTNGTLIFYDGETVKTIAIPILDDAVLEAYETAVVVLTNFAKATPGTYVAGVITIVDDELLSAPAGSVNGGFNAGVNDFVNAIAIQRDSRMIIGGKFTAVNLIPRNRIARVNPGGALDATFDPGPGANDTVNAVALQGDDKVVVAGSFTRMGQAVVGRLARLNRDGLLDSSFNSGAGADNPINALAINPVDGSMVIGGAFVNYNGVSRPRVARLDVNGGLITSFATGTGPNAPVKALAFQGDGKVLIGGEFTSVNGTNRAYIARLGANGALDLSFNPPAGINGSVAAVAVQGDGRIVIGGAFTNVDGAVRKYLARLDPNGALDPTFMADALGADDSVSAIALQADGKILVGGNFRTFNGVTRNRLTRLNADGTTDPSINFGAGANGFVAAVALQPDDQIVVGGGFTTFDGQPRPYLAQLIGGANSGAGSVEFAQGDWTVDEFSGAASLTVRRNGGTSGRITVDYATSDGTAVAGQDYAAAAGTLTFEPGEALVSFQVGIINDSQPEDTETATLALSNPTGGATLGGQAAASLSIRSEDSLVTFSSASYIVNENAPGGFATITVTRSHGIDSAISIGYAAGGGTATPDLDYTPKSGTLNFAPGELTRNFTVAITNDLEVEADETVDLTLFSPAGPALLAQTNSTLTIVSDDFGPGLLVFSATNYAVVEASTEFVVTVLRRNGAIGQVSVQYSTTAGTATPGIDYTTRGGVLTFGDGETNKTFTVPINSDVVIEPNETIRLNMFNATGGALIGQNSAILTVLDDDAPAGSVDTNAPGLGANDSVHVARPQADGRVLVGGDFTAINGATMNRIARLNGNGSLDVAFSPGAGADGSVRAIGVQADGRIVIGGLFTNVGGLAVPRVARLEPGGAVDTNFRTGSGPNDAVYAVGMGVVPPFATADAAFPLPGTFNTQTNTVNVGATMADVTLDFVSAAASFNNVRVYFGGSPFPVVNQNLLGSDSLSFQVGPGSATNTLLRIEVNTGYQLTNFWSYTATISPVEQSVIVGGAFSSFNGVPRTYLARLSPNGVLDPAFNPTLDGPVRAIAVQTNGQILIGGDFLTVNGASQKYVARLNFDGSLDTMFMQNTLNARVLAMELQGDGSLLIGGEFTLINSLSRNRIARLATNGVLDGTFYPGTGVQGTVRSLVTQADGKVLLGGEFGSVDGRVRNNYARLNTNGVLDTTFNLGAGANDVVYAVSMLLSTLAITNTAGVIRVTDDYYNHIPTFTTVTNIETGARSGTVDISVDTFTYYRPSTLRIYYETNVLLSGVFLGPQQYTVPYGPGTSTVVRITIDEGLTFGGYWSYSAVITPDISDAVIGATNRALIGGRFTTVNGQARSHLAVVDNGGGIDPVLDERALIYDLALQPDGKVIVGGDFSVLYGAGLNRVARLEADGSIDLGFNPGAGANAAVRSVSLQTNGQVVIAGLFTNVQNTFCGRLARLNADGSLDATFNTGSGADGAVLSAALQANGQILLGGAFLTINGAPRDRLARLNPDGSLDVTFLPGSGADATVRRVLPMEDGRILIAGDFLQVQGAGYSRIARLQTNGLLDTNFARVNVDGAIYALARQTDGRLLIGGSFALVNGVSRPRIARLEADGALDPSFNPGAGPENVVQSIAILPDGKLLVGGAFTVYDGVPRNRFVRLNPDGSLDTSINFGTGANGVVNVSLMQSSQYIMVGGSFTAFDGVPRNGIARLNAGANVGPGSLVFGAPTYTVAENGASLRITVIRQGGLAGTSTVEYRTVGGTADSLRDYIPTNGTLTFLPNDTVKAFNLGIRDDAVVDGDKTVLLELSQPTGASLGAQSNTTVVITDNDCEFYFATSAFSVSEDGGNATITVLRSGGYAELAAVSFYTYDMTASAGTNYLGTNGTLVFGVGVSNLSFAVPILDDAAPNESRTVCLVLTNASGAAQIRPGGGTAILTILDDDGGPGFVRFLSASYTFAEGQPAAQITVVRTNGRTGVITVDYTAGGGTALPGIDYEPRSDSLSFADGETVQTILIPLRDDTVVDGSKTVFLTLTNVTGGATLTNPVAAVLFIRDDDFGAGSLDPTFDPGSGANGMVRSVAVYPDRSVLVGGLFTMFDNTNRNYVARLKPDGSLDQQFAQGTYLAVTNSVTNAVTNIYGTVTYVPTNVVTYVVTNAGANAAISAVGVTPDGRAILGGAFTNVNGTRYRHLARLNTNGTPDTSFNKLTNLNAAVNAMFVMPDGKSVIGGGFSQPAPRVMRVRPDGNTDISFNPGQGADGPVHSVFVLPGGQVVIGGSFNHVNGVHMPRVARLDSSGALDTIPGFFPVSFTNGSTTGTVYAVAVQADGRIIVGGDFTHVNGVARGRLARLNVDGTLDETFATVVGANRAVYALAIQSHGQVIVGGDFTSLNGVSLNRFGRLLPDGSVDPHFFPGQGADNTVYSIALMAGGDIMIGGDFSTVNGLPRRGVARLIGNRNQFISWSWSALGTELELYAIPSASYVLEGSASLGGVWTTIATNRSADSVVRFTDPGAVAAGRRFYRAKQVTP